MRSRKSCTFDGCDKPHIARGLCKGHWQQQRKGQELRPLRSQITLEQRFWVKVNKTDECWSWTAATDRHGYGHIRVDGRLRRAHRLAWEFINGPIADGMLLDHRCANRKCVNPEHLRVVTHGQNNQHLVGSRKNNTSGVRGVSWKKDKNAWRARATLHGRTYSGGYHPTIEAADKAARALRARLFSHDDHHVWSHNKEKP